jgi:cyclic-di-GMP-binding protein
MTVIEHKNPFILPERLTPTSLEEEYDHKRFEQWVSDLTIGNVSKIAHALYNETDRLNRLEISPLERFGALELVHPSMGFVLEQLHDYFATEPIPLSKKNRLVARMHLELLVRVVVGYKTVLAQFHDDSFTGYILHKHARSEASRRILYFLGEILLHEYSIYRSSPRFVWKEIHGVYYYAVQNDLLYKQIDAPEDDPCDHLSLMDIYKRILLLAVADPNSLLRGEVRKVNEALIQWLPHVTIAPVDDDAFVHPNFLVDATKDAPPCPEDISDRDQVKIGWILVTDVLDEILEHKIQAMESDAFGQLRPTDAISIKLITKLRAAWERRIAEREERKQETAMMEVTCGISWLYQLFDGEQFPQALAGKQGSSFYTIEAEEIDQAVKPIGHDEFIIDVDEELLSGLSTESEQVHEEEVELELINLSPIDESKGVECILINSSEKGYYLTWPEQNEYKAHVGELIGINSRENLDLSGAWSLGIIRWAHVRKNGIMGFGIELLDGDIEPIRIERWYDNDAKADIMLGFQQVVNGKVESTITYPFYIGDKDRFVLGKKGERISIVPDQIIECTDAIMRFTIKTDAGGVVEAGSTKHSASDDLFNTIWDDLDI